MGFFAFRSHAVTDRGTMAIEGFDELSDDEIEARQRAEDGEDASHDPKAGDDTEDAAKAAAEAQATADAEAAQVAAAEEAARVAAEAAAATAAGADAAKEPAKVEGVQSKDGTRVLPYAALQAERRSARAANARAERTERELDAARQLIADLKAGKNPDSDSLTEEKVADMEANFPEEGKKLRTAFNRIQELEAKVPKAQPSHDEPADDPAQEAIDQVPLLLDWQHQDAEKFARAVEHDALLLKSPKWKDKPTLERFAEATRRTAEEYDIAFEPKASTKAAPAATPSTAAATQAQRKPPETLSDFKGGSIADHGSMDVAKASPQQLLGRMQDMTDEQIEAHLSKYG